MSNDTTASIRRLPVYLMLDCSGSMAGEPIAAMEMGIGALLSDLRNDPQALENVWLSVITFDDTAEQIAPLTDVEEFEVPALEASGTTALGEALALLAERMKEEVRPTAPDQKGDWKPLVFLFTDGEPTDDWEGPIDEFQTADKATMVACGAGPEVNDDMLKRLGHKAVRLDNTQPGTLGEFMQWVSLAVTMTSKSLGTRATSGEMLPDLPEDRGIHVVP